MKKIFALFSGIRQSLLPMLMVMGILGFVSPAALAQDDQPEPPAIRMFYPGQSTPPQTAKTTDTSKYYIYFVTSTNAVYCKGNLVQNGEVKGVLRYRPTSATATSSATLMAVVSENPDIKNIDPGEFTIEIYEVQFIVGDETYLYSDAANPIGSVTYKMAGTDGSLVSYTEASEILSYYPVDSEDGVLSFTFSKALSPANISAYFEYGQSDQYVTYSLPYTLSADACTLTIDLRGVCHNPEALAPGEIWYDDNGNTIEPPTRVSLELSGLKCADGTNIVTTIENPETGAKYYQTAKARFTYELVDLTFEDPILSMARFYDSATPDNKQTNLSAAVNMMSVNVSQANLITYADLAFYFDDNTIVIPDNQITKSGSSYVVSIPEEVRLSTAENVEIGLENVTYSRQDGVEHQVKRLSLTNITKEVTSIAELKTYEAGDVVLLNVNDGIKVTLANDYGYTFAEDATGGIQIVTADNSKPFEEGALVKGLISGIYQGYDIFMVDVAKSSYTVAMANVAVGTIITSVDELTADLNNTLVTISASAALPIVNSDGVVVIGETLPVITDFIAEDFEAPETIQNVTGIYYSNSQLGMTGVIVRSDADFNQDLGFGIVCSTIAEVLSANPDTELQINLNNVKVTFSDGPTTIIEDATGALLVVCDDDSQFCVAGKAVTGQVRGIYQGGNVFVAYSEETLIDLSDADVSAGIEITAENIGNLNDASFTYRLVTFNKSESTPFDVESYGITIGGGAAEVVDYFKVLDEDYEFPANAVAVTGIIMPNMFAPFSELDEEEAAMPAIVAVRSVADIVVAESGDINGDGDVNSSDLGMVINFVTGAQDSVNWADLNNDGEVDASDLGVIINIIVGIISM